MTCNSSSESESLRSEREHESIRGPRDRALVEVHRRRADERGDEQVRRALVELLGRGQLLERARKRFTAYTWEAFRRTVLIGQTPSHAGAEMKVTSLAVMQARARVLAWMRQEAEDLLA